MNLTTPRIKHGYPKATLRHAVQAVSNIYENTKLNPLNNWDDLLAAMDYRSKHGLATKMYTALKRYQLLVLGLGGYVLSETAQRIALQPADSPIRLRALREASLASPLMRKLSTRFSQNPNAEEAAMAHWLTTTANIAPTQAAEAVRIFSANNAYLTRLASLTQRGDQDMIELPESAGNVSRGVTDAGYAFGSAAENHVHLDLGDFWADVRVGGKATAGNVEFLLAALRLKLNMPEPELNADPLE